MLGASVGLPGNAYFVTDGEPVVFREFVVRAAPHSGRRTADALHPPWLADGDCDLGRDGLARAATRGAAHRWTRFAYWVTSQECTIRIDKAREQLGYQAGEVASTRGLAELRGG